MKTADALDAQGEVALAGDVRQFANHLPPVLTDKERLAVDARKQSGPRAIPTLVGIPA